MPFEGPEDERLPTNVKKLPKKLRAVWCEVWTDTMRRTGDEGKAFAAANGVVKKAEEGSMSGEEKGTDVVFEGITDQDKGEIESELAGWSVADVTSWHRRLHMWASKGSLLTGFSKADMNWYHAATEKTLHKKAKTADKESGAESPLEWGEVAEASYVAAEECTSDVTLKIAKRGREKKAGTKKESVGDGTVTGEAVRRAAYDQLRATPVVGKGRETWGFAMQALDALFEVGRRHSQADVDLIDKIIGLLQELRRNEAAEPLPATEAAKTDSQAADDKTADAQPPEDKGKTIMAFCPKCGKKVPLLDAKEAKVAGRPVMQGKCEKGHPVSVFVEAEESARTQYVSEAILLTEATAVLDEGAHEVELTLIKPGWSQNDRYYSPDVLRSAAKLFEGCKAYADHPAKSQDADRPERSVRDIVGYYPKVGAAEDGSLKGRLRVIGESINWLWPLIVETVRNNAQLVFTSINALGKVKAGEVGGRKGMVVEGIVKANSADVVTQAAAGGQFERLLASDDGFTADLLAALDYDEWIASRPDFAVRLKEEMKTARAEEVTESVRAENAALREELAKADKTVGECNKAVEEQKGLVAGLEKERDGFDAKIRGAEKAKGEALAELRQRMAAREAEHRAETLILKSNVPDVLVEAVRPRVMAAFVKGNEDEAKQAIEEERGKLRKAVATEAVVEVKGGGQAPNAPPLTNPVAGLLGVSVVALPGETAEEYGVRKQRILEAKRE